MSLTKPRAHQLLDIDYKQAVRAITTTNVTLSGGAPATVDSVELAAKDRVLVTGQSTASENGLYQVVIAGTGSNGTWTRSQDAANTGELLAGVVVMVTEGTVFADTQFKLTTDNPVIIGTTPLTWEQNSAFAFGNIVANGISVLADSVGDTVTLTAGNNIAIVGNASSKSVSISVTGISLDSIGNGTSNVAIPVADGNVVTTVNGNNILTVSDTGVNVIGSVATTGNVAGGNLVTTGTVTTATVTATGNITSANIEVSGQLSVPGVVSSDLIPAADDAHSLGNATNRWSNLFLTGNTIQLGNLQLKDSNGTLAVFQSDGETPAEVQSAVAISETTVFADGSELGTVDVAVTISLDLGSITDIESVKISLGSITLDGLAYPSQLVLPSFTVAELGNTATTPPGQMVLCIDEIDGAVPAFSDGTNWRRVTDRSVVS